MNRHSVSVCLLAASVIAVAGIACSNGSEQALLTEFFAASRLRDTTTLSSMAFIVFEPRTQGTVTTFDIVNAGAEQREPLSPPALAPANEAFAKRNVLSLSIVDLSARTAVGQREGELVSKDVTIAARVAMPDGQTVRKTLIVTMQRAILRGDKPVVGRWVITACRGAGL
jgi:hypothetical protein